MKKSLLALAVMGAFASSAYADEGLFHFTNGDTSLELYGILDAAVVTQNHAYSLNNTLPNQSYSYVGKIYSAAPSQSAAVNGGLSDSRLGLKGSTGLTSGVKAIFDLESGFDITNFSLNNAAGTLAANPSTPAFSNTNLPQTLNADSSLNGNVFNRAAWVGVEASWGTLTVGTQNNPVKDAIGAYDPVKSDTFSPFGESGTVGGGVGSSEESRLHHSVKYTTKFGNGFDASVAYQFGNDANTSYGKTYAARVGYENGPLGVTAAYSNSKDAIVASNGNAFGNIKLNIYDVDGYLLAAKYKATNELHLSGGYEHYERKTPGDAIQTIGSIWGYAVQTTVAGFNTGGVPNAGESQAYNIYFAGGDYDFTPDLNLAAGYYNTKADTTSIGTVNSDYTISTWSSVLKYKMTKTLDLYAAATVNSYGGGVYTAAPGTFATSVSAYGVGARFKF
jgi:predicted porin